MSLVRDAKTLILKYQFADGIRILTLQGHTDYQICQKILNWILNEKLPILVISADKSLLKKKNLTSLNEANISEELENEGKYFIEWLKKACKQQQMTTQTSEQSINLETGELAPNDEISDNDNEEEKKSDETQNEDEMETIATITSNQTEAFEEENDTNEEIGKNSNPKLTDLFDLIFEQSILQCHATMIYFLVCNDFLENVGAKVFDNGTKNIFEFLFDSCYHRSDIIETLLITFNEHFDAYLPELLATETGGTRENYDPEYLIDKFVQNDESLQFGMCQCFLC